MSATLAQYTGAMGKWQYSNGAGTWADIAVYDNSNVAVHTGSQPFATAVRSPSTGWFSAT